ncbi:MAG TPA: diguanylate cyclase [Acidimicrobiales bacterium]|nr:diguanylate cyclase [Acidimicrobiales bacterium]
MVFKRKSPRPAPAPRLGGDERAGVRLKLPPIQSLETVFAEISSAGESTAEDRHAAAYDDLWQLAMADPRTGLPNQLLLLDRLQQALARRERHGMNVVVFYVKIRDLNFGSGLGAEEIVFEEATRRLAGILRSEDTIGRLSGRELLIVAEVARRDVVDYLSNRVRSALQAPFEVAGTNVGASATFGWAIAGPAESAQGLLARVGTSL